MKSRDLLIQILRQPEKVDTLTLPELDLLVRQARHAGLLGQLGYRCRQQASWERLPQQFKSHLLSMETVQAKQQQGLNWELRILSQVMSRLDLPLLLLKGAAYNVLGLEASRGRVFNDIDILVPKERLRDVELALNNYGWICGIMDAYDKRYYRQWMHELPPLKHIIRKSGLDVHHTILPPTARYRPDPDKLWKNKAAVPSWPGVYTLNPIDMIIHSATHLFHEGELEDGLRGLLDLDSLMQEFSRHHEGGEQAFWSALVERSGELDLVTPVFYGLHYCRRLLATPVPDEAVKALGGDISGLKQKRMDSLFDRALRPDHPSCDDWATGFARWAIYVRSHYLRMSLFLLVPHLIRKALRAN